MFSLAIIVLSLNSGVRHSVQGVLFRFWLPLPLSETHWERVRYDVDDALAIISECASYGDAESVYVIFKLLNDIIVRLSKETEETAYRSPVYPYEERVKSTLKHASEKAIEILLSHFSSPFVQSYRGGLDRRLCQYHRR